MRDRALDPIVRARSDGRALGAIEAASAPPRVALHNDPKVRGAVYQLVLLAVVLWFGYEFALNAKANLEAQQDRAAASASSTTPPASASTSR